MAEPYVSEGSEANHDVFNSQRAYDTLWRESLRAFSNISRPLTVDEQELVEAARERAGLPPLGKKRLDRQAKKELVEEMVQLGSSEGQTTVQQKLGQLLRAAGDEQRWLPEVTVEYRNLTIEADALVGSASVPSVGQSAKGTLKKLLCQGGLPTKRIVVLHEVSGRLVPGRITLLLGPPGSGKSVLLQALGGRLRSGPRLHVRGDIKYNGLPISEFNVGRSAGLVGQYDHHIPSLSVFETLEFSANCQLQKARIKEFAAAIGRASELLAGQKRASQVALKAAAAAEDGAAGGAADGEHDASKLGEKQQQVQGQPSERMLAPHDFDEQFAELFRQGAQYGLKPFFIMYMLGLQDVMRTLVGDAMTRGISGGQRKRVTSGEVLVGPQNVILMDEISTGLDSATTYSVVKSLRSIAHSLRKTLIVSLLQPPPEVLGLFDDLMLLTDGRVLFHGPVTEALPFFGTLGFVCPVRKDPASWLQEITTPVGQLSYAAPALLAQNCLTEADRAPARLLEAPPTALLMEVEQMSTAFWADSKSGQAMLEALEKQPFDRAAGSKFALQHTRYANAWLKLMLLVLKRQLLLNVRMRPFHIARSVQAVVMALITASLFGKISVSDTSGRDVLSLSMLNTAFAAMMQMPQIGMVFATKAIFYKQRDMHFFGSSQYVVAMNMTQLPMSLSEAVLYTIPLFFITGLSRAGGRYFIFLAIYYSVSNSLASLYRLMAFAVPNMIVANAAGALTLLACIITNGFTILSCSIPRWLIWVYWINPMAWSLRAFAVNELTSPRWQEQSVSVDGQEVSVGLYTLDSFCFRTSTFYIWFAVVYLWMFEGACTAAGMLALRLTNLPKPQPSVSEEDQKVEVARGVFDQLQRALGRAAAGMEREVRRVASRGVIAPAGSKEAPSEAEKAEQHAPTSNPNNEANAKATAAATAGVKGSEEATADTVAAVVLASSAAATAKTVVPFTPITLVCRGLRYYVPDPSGGTVPGVVKDSADKEIEGKLELLQGIDIFAEPGELTALMGGSGAGKTTLMDCILGRKTVGLIRGDILVNGHPKDQATWSRVAGYVEQQDIHTAESTVSEALYFSARLRLSEDINMSSVKALVEQTLDLVELTPLARQVVGEAGSGLSIEQRKRLSIAVEMVANPSVMMLDEPTSGLDARAAAIVMRAVKNVALSGRTVMVVIHQPSIDIFEQFTQLVLLQRGGRVTYFGPLGEESCELIAYLQGLQAPPIASGHNPATWMLEVTGGGGNKQAATSDFPSLYAQSELKRRNDAKADTLAAEGQAAHAPLALAGRYAAGGSTQRKWLMLKWNKLYWRSPSYNWVRLVMTVAVALVYGLMYLHQGKIGDTASIAEVQNISGLIFSMSIFLGMFNCMIVMPLISSERLVYYRERSVSMYGPQPFLLAQTVVELPYLLVQAFLMVIITYWMVGFQGVAWKWFYFYLTYVLTLMMFTFLGHALVYATPNQLVAQLLASALNQLWTLFNGFLLPYPTMPAGWKWMNRISPTTWILYGLSCSQLCDREVPMSNLNGQPTTISAFVDSFFGWESGMIWWCTLIVAGFAIFFRVVAALAVNFINFQRR